MEIKRKFELLITTNRLYTIRQSPSVKQIACAECGEPMLTTEQAAGLFSINQRRIFQIIETEAVHFSEVKTEAVMVCITSLAENLNETSIIKKHTLPAQTRHP